MFLYNDSEQYILKSEMYTHIYTYVQDPKYIDPNKPYTNISIITLV